MSHKEQSLFPFTVKEQSASIKESCYGPKKIQYASRNQIEITISSLDDLVPDAHPVRAVWDYVEGLDLSKALNKIESCEGSVGRSAIDPKILLALWLICNNRRHW